MCDAGTTLPLHDGDDFPVLNKAYWGTVNIGLQVSLEDLDTLSRRRVNTASPKSAADRIVQLETGIITGVPGNNADYPIDSESDSDNWGMSSEYPSSDKNENSLDADDNFELRDKTLGSKRDNGNGSLATRGRSSKGKRRFISVNMDEGRQHNNVELEMTEAEHVRPHGRPSSAGMTLAQVVELAQTKERKIPAHNLGGWGKVKRLVRGIADMKKSMLVHTKRQRLEERDFHREVRPTQDIKNFMNEATVIFHLPGTNIHDVIMPMLTKVLTNESGIKLEEARRALFTDESSSLLSHSLQSSVMLGGGMFFEESWLCAFASHKNLQRRHVAIGRLRRPTNLGFTCSDVRFVVLVLAPAVEKGTKNSMETAITFGTLFTDINFRVSLWEEAGNEEEFLKILRVRVNELSDNKNIRNVVRRRDSQTDTHNPFLQADTRKRCTVLKGVREDMKRRIPKYKSDFRDGIYGGAYTLRVLITTIIFLYFSCLLFALSLGVLNDKNTHGYIGVKKALVGQIIAGLVGGIFGGQPLMVLATSAPLALFTKVIYMFCEERVWDFHLVYGSIGICSSGFLILFAVLDLSKYMKWSTRSVDEVFSVFVSCTLIKEAIDALRYNFNQNYSCLKGISENMYVATNVTWEMTKTNITHEKYENETGTVEGVLPGMIIHNTTTIVRECVHGTCYPENSLLFLMLMLGVPWVGITLYRFKKSPFLATLYRELLSNQALAITVILWSFIGSYCFKDVHLTPFPYNHKADVFTVSKYREAGYAIWLSALGLGLSHALMVFMEHNITGSILNSPENKLKKGTSYHWDLLLCGILNLFFAIFGLPMVHGIVPLSPMHVRALADVEERVHYGYVQTIIVRVRETRLTVIVSHIFLGVSLLMLPLPLQYIPMAVLAGVYIFLAIQLFVGNQLFERMLLFITEQSAYPPSHYVRRVPQRKMHLFTLIEVVELIVLCVFGFSSISYMKMVFPVILILYIPIRQLLIPRIIEKKYLESLDMH